MKIRMEIGESRGRENVQKTASSAETARRRPGPRVRRSKPPPGSVGREKEKPRPWVRQGRPPAQAGERRQPRHHRVRQHRPPEAAGGPALLRRKLRRTAGPAGLCPERPRGPAVWAFEGWCVPQAKLRSSDLHYIPHTKRSLSRRKVAVQERAA